MTQDVIALTPGTPDARAVLAGLYAGGPDLGVSSSSEGAAVQLYADDGRLLVTVEVPLLVQVPGEARRLLGTEVLAEAPVWWTEVRATTSAEEAGHLAESVAGRLTTVLGGSTWPPRAARTGVVSVPSSGGDASAAQSDQCGVDVLTDRAAVVIQDRPVIAATTWLTDLLHKRVSSGRELQIVTPPDARLTLPTRTLLTHAPARWVIRDPACGYYNGLTGSVLHWHDGRFTPALAADGRQQIADAYNAHATVEGEQQLHLSIRTTHPAGEGLLLGGALETAWQILTGSPPAGWSTAEPVNLPWSPRQLTELARARALKSAPTWLVAVGATGRPAIATLRVTHTSAGIEEHITLGIGCPADQAPPIEHLPELAEALVTDHRLTSMLTQLRPARADLTAPPHHEGPPIPISFVLGADAANTVGLTAAQSPPGTPPTRLGPSARPGLYYALSDGTDPMAWQRLKQLDDHLKTLR